MWYLIVSIPDLCTITYFDFTVLIGTLVESQEMYTVLTGLLVFFSSFLCVEWLISLYFSGTLLLEMSQFFLCFSDMMFSFLSFLED